MDEDDEMILVIVENDEKNSESEDEMLPLPFPLPIKEEPMDEDDMVKIIETAMRHGQSLDYTSQEKTKVEVEGEIEDYDHPDRDYVKEEYNDNDDDNDDETFKEAFMNIKDEYLNDDANGDGEYDPNEEEEDSSASGSECEVDNNKHRTTLVAAAQRKSFVEELKQQYPELQNNRDALVKSLAEIMRSLQRPPPPPDYFILNDILFECRLCGSMSVTEPAAARHYQEKHGPRYLICFACGVDFRSTTNLYKHEKRCVAPDAGTMLRARALCLGSKGRGRPFIPKAKDVLLREPIGRKFECTDCPAVFTAKVNLIAHLNTHKGLRPYRCTTCPHAYTSATRLRRHMRLHSDEHYMCDHCGRPFKDKAALVVHLNTHAPLRKFDCKECERRFASKFALSHHVRRVHRKLPPACACPICPMSYPRMSLVRDHMKKKHGMSLMTRKMFFKAMPRLTDLQLQQAKEILKSDTPLCTPASDTEFANS